jgi:gamma-glutamylcyclotransferase
MSSKYYFAYGSNLAKAQMVQRCPESTFKGAARLSSYKWLICEPGYANVVKQESVNQVVWGLVFCLSKSDEALLDRYEGVPYAYIKENLNVDHWPADNGNSNSNTVSQASKSLTALVYVDVNNTTTGNINSEYVFRMGNGLRDALSSGIPLNYIVEVLLPHIHAGKRCVPALWEEYRDCDGENVSDEVPAGDEEAVKSWLIRLLDKIKAIGDAWGSKG